MGAFTWAWRIFKNKADEYYRWEIERYWAFFRSVSRFGYNPDTDHDVWMRPFQARFGAAADPVAKAYEEASRVIALVVSSHINNINMYVWPEKSMGGSLGVYLDLRGADKMYFPSIDDQVAEELAGTLTGRPGPDGLAGEYEKIADAVERLMPSERSDGLASNKEFLSTRADFLMLAHLARYHAYRQREGRRMARFYSTGDVGEANTALAEARQAVDEWRALVALAERWDYDRMQFAPVENGHWKDSLFLVEKEPVFVQDAIDVFKTYGLFDRGFDFGRQPMAANSNIFRFWKYLNSYDMAPRFIGLSGQSRYSPQSGYGWVEAEGLKETPMPSFPARQLSGEDPDPKIGLPRNALFSDFVSGPKPFTFRVDLPMEAHRLTLIFSDLSEKPSDHGPFFVKYGPNRTPNPQETISVPAGKVVHSQADRNLRLNWNPFELVTVEPSSEGAEGILSGPRRFRDETQPRPRAPDPRRSQEGRRVLGRHHHASPAGCRGDPHGLERPPLVSGRSFVAHGRRPGMEEHRPRVGGWIPVFSHPARGHAGREMDRVCLPGRGSDGACDPFARGAGFREIPGPSHLRYDRARDRASADHGRGAGPADHDPGKRERSQRCRYGADLFPPPRR